MKKFLIIISILTLIAVAFLYFQERQKSLKIGFVTDWEYSKEISSEEKNGFLAKELLLKAVAHYNYFFKPDLVVAGGDYLGKTFQKKESLQEIIVFFEKIRAPKLYALGKKDYRPESLEQTKEILGIENSYYSQIFKGVNVIILDTTQGDETTSSTGKIEADQLSWLRKELSKPEPVLIFSHHSLIETPNNDIWRKNLANQDELYELVKENNKKIIAAFSGNSRKDYITKKSGVPFVNVSGLTSSFSLGRFTDIEIIRDKESPLVMKISLENNGQNGSLYQIDRDLETSTSTRIKLVKKHSNITNQRWFDLEDLENPSGVVCHDAGGEANLSITEKGNPVVAFESKEKQGKIQVKLFKNGEWEDLEDDNHPEGLVSSGAGGNPVLETRGEDVFVVFSEKDFDQKIKLLHWSEESQAWQELTPDGFLSNQSGHEATLAFDKNKENLYLAFAEKIGQGEQKQARIMKWDGEKIETITRSLSIFASEAGSSVDEFDLVASATENSMYLAYEEITNNDFHFIRVKKWDGIKWSNLNFDQLYSNTISRLNGFSPTIAVDEKENLYLSFIENSEENLHVYKYDQAQWKSLGDGLLDLDDSQKVKEPSLEIGLNNTPYLAYSEHKDNVVMALDNDKNTGEELIKTSAWRVRVRKFQNEKWVDLEDELNYGGYVSKGSGKGDPTIKIFKNNLYIIFSDEENDYAARVKKYFIK